ncbi:hypothetical protein [Haladaptatus salinisoli]|uniref:hypothetical protein n=1 Tax=Haladaptatus salinisoli TaxID=2884876 RepID=UPI001D0AE537|nr:hypothetical protein [Haladaptatus salinisoli]
MGTRIRDTLTRYWKRRTDRPDYVQAYVKLPLDTELPALAHEFEVVCGGRLDRVPRRDAVLVNTDYVPAERFDSERFEEVVGELRDACPDRYALHESTKWRPHGDGVAKTHTLVPVRPLFSASESEGEGDPVRGAPVRERPR